MLPSGIKATADDLQIVASSTPGMYVVQMPDRAAESAYDFFAPSEFATEIEETQVSPKAAETEANEEA